MKTRLKRSRLLMLLPIVVVFSSQAFAQNVNVCNISGQITNDKREYRTKVKLLRDDSSKRVVLTVATRSTGKYSFRNVPPGTYLVAPRGNYPGSSGNQPGGLAPFPWTERLVCEPNGNYTVNFRIDSTEG